MPSLATLALSALLFVFLLALLWIGYAFADHRQRQKVFAEQRRHARSTHTTFPSLSPHHRPRL